MRVGAAAASLGALLALIAGIGRTSLAMAREDDLPRYFAAVHPRWRVPHRAEIAVAVIVIATVLLVDLRGAIAFSSFGVLIYYFIANVAACRQSAPARLYPRALQWLGAVGCVVLVVTLPPSSGSSSGTAVVLLGVAYRAIRLRRAVAERTPSRGRARLGSRTAAAGTRAALSAAPRSAPGTAFSTLPSLALRLYATTS